MTALDGVLIALLAAQQFYYLREIQKLVDKIMSRSYAEYSRAKEPQRPIKPELILSAEPEEDLGPLAEFIR